MYASRGIGRKIYEDRHRRDVERGSPMSSESQSPVIYRSDRHERHDSLERQVKPERHDSLERQVKPERHEALERHERYERLDNLERYIRHDIPEGNNSLERYVKRERDDSLERYKRFDSLIPEPNNSIERITKFERQERPDFVDRYKRPDIPIPEANDSYERQLKIERPDRPFFAEAQDSIEKQESNEMALQLQKQLEEKLFQERMTAAFLNINSIEELINMKETYKKKSVSLEQLLQKSILREGEILRNKRRDRTGYKDPAIIENRKLQNDVKKKIEEVDKFMVEIDKRLRAYNKAVQATKEEKSSESEKPSNYEAQLLQNSLISTTGEQDEEEEEAEDEYEATNATFEYYDPGSHWCRDCDKLIPKIKDYFDHLHTKDHWKLVQNECQPWKKAKKSISIDIKTTKTKAPIKGVQFLVPIRGFYCPLCSQYLADQNTAEEHLRSAKHNRIYLRFTCLNIDYEHKWISDKGKALSRHQLNEKKRLKEEEQKENEKKRMKEEQRIKEEKEAKRRRIEEENRREKERESSREKSEKDYKIIKSENNSNGKSSDRFRLKEVTVDLNAKKEKFSFNKMFGKDSHNRNEKQKHKKRKRHFSSSSESSSESFRSEPLKKRTYFGDPYKDPKLKLKPFVPLNRLTPKTCKKYNCYQLSQLIDDSKLKNKAENESLKVEIDFNVNNEEVFETNEIQSNINDILKNMDEKSDEKERHKESNENIEQNIKTIDQSEPEVEKGNDSSVVNDSTDGALVIDTSVSENTNNANESNVKDTVLPKPQKNAEYNSDDQSDSPCVSETILSNNKIDELSEDSQSCA